MSEHPGVAAWHAYMQGGSQPEALQAMLADDAVFHSPVVHTPQAGKAKVFVYLHAASHVLGNDSFTYERELVDGNQAMLEFACTVDGIHINGVDIIRWNDAGLIEDFKVMVRPLKAMNMLW
uniref:nuclear transport factor 2 family protein n=1 Tax=Blastomonas sp. TaxID=1909299 RepID=UPI003593CBEB